MDLFKAALTSVATGVGNYVSKQSKEEKLREQLFRCTYSDDVKFVIEKAVKQVLHVYPHFQTQILEFSEKGQQKRYLEIKGIMQIEIRGKICKVDYNMMLPSAFPNKSPYVRIINHSSEYIVDPLYKDLRSPTDPKSFILNSRLDTVKKWTSSSSVVNIIIESHNMMRNNFPFAKPGGNSGMNNNYQQGFNSGWGVTQPNNSPWQQQPNYGGNQGYNQYGNQPNYNNPQQMGGMGGFNKPRPPIPFNSPQNGKTISETIAEGQKFVGSSKIIMEKLKTQHLKSVQKIQTLETIKYSVASQQQYLRNQNMNILEFLRHNETSNMQDLSSLVTPKGERSQQILELTSSLKARDDCINLLETKFNDGELSFQDFIKMVRKMEEDKFEQKVLLAKCIEYARV